MARIDILSEEMLRMMRRKLRKQGMTLVRNKKTGVVYTRHIVEKVKPATESQSCRRNAFAEQTHKASEWLKANNPEACPPKGSAAYQDVMKKFRRQDKIKQLLNFVVSRIDQIATF